VLITRHPAVAAQILATLSSRSTIFSAVRRQVPCPLQVLLDTLTDLVIDRHIIRRGTGGQTYFSLPAPEEYTGPPVTRVPVPAFSRAGLERVLAEIFSQTRRTFGLPELYLRARSVMPQVEERMILAILARWLREGTVEVVDVAWQRRYRRVVID
jgi:hypothetical protein